MIIFCKSNAKIYKMNKKNEVLTSFLEKKCIILEVKQKKAVLMAAFLFYYNLQPDRVANFFER